MGHVVGHRVELVRLHRQDHHVVHAGCGVVVGGAHVARDLLAAIGLDQLDAVIGDGLQIGAAHEEGDLVAGQRQPGSDGAADGAGTDDCELHFRFPLQAPSVQCAEALESL